MICKDTNGKTRPYIKTFYDLFTIRNVLCKTARLEIEYITHGNALTTTTLVDRQAGERVTKRNLLSRHQPNH